MVVGTAVAYNHAGLFFARRYFGLLAAAVLVITWLNLSNDVYDSDTGADKNKKESVVNIVGSRAVTEYAANVSLLLGFGGLFWAFAEAGDVRFIVLVLCAILCGYVYQCPPFRLSYRGLGEPLCFAAFGPLATSAFYFSNSSRSISSGAVLLPLTKTVIASSILVGLTTTLILFCSHFHQIEGDRAVGKMSPLVRIGTKTGATLVTVAIGALYTLLAAFGISRCLPPSCIDDTKIFMAKYYCVRLHALLGMALASGLVLARNGVLA
uniref:Putative 1,4-dihydroxy-2-naphthoate octaprenyltransferase n=1 Tax=Aegilops tauschii TaxID=37682 RepID=M8BME8_AEGTA